jgi:serine/threonine protein phosphatase 1
MNESPVFASAGSSPAAPDAPATYVIGDIHGEAQLLRALLAQLPLRPEDSLVFIGDAVDRGPDSLGVVRLLLALREAIQPGAVILIKGNHEEDWDEVWDPDTRTFVGAALMPGAEALWRQLLKARSTGRGQETEDDLRTYLKATQVLHEDEWGQYSHAGAAPGVDFRLTPPDVAVNSAPGFWTDRRGWGGKPVVFGHYEVLDEEGHPAPFVSAQRICVDTAAWRTAVLTAIQLPDRRLYQTQAEDRHS